MIQSQISARKTCWNSFSDRQSNKKAPPKFVTREIWRGLRANAQLSFLRNCWP